jgi:hypothetical protein
MPAGAAASCRASLIRLKPGLPLILNLLLKAHDVVRSPFGPPRRGIGPVEIVEVIDLRIKIAIRFHKKIALRATGAGRGMLRPPAPPAGKHTPDACAKILYKIMKT